MRASVGTARTLFTVDVVMLTVIGAWSRLPAAAGSVSRMSTFTVAAGALELLELELLLESLDPLDPDPLPDDVPLAVVPMDVTTPGVVWLFGSVMDTFAPTPTSGRWVGPTWATACLVSEVPVSTGVPGRTGVPSVAATSLTRTALGWNTAWPTGRVPV